MSYMRQNCRASSLLPACIMSAQADNKQSTGSIQGTQIVFTTMYQNYKHKELKWIVQSYQQSTICLNLSITHMSLLNSYVSIIVLISLFDLVAKVLFSISGH